MTATAACPPPVTHLTVAQAHQLMREHLRCRTEDCHQREAALATLVDAGHYVLAASRPAPTTAVPASVEVP